MVCKKFKCETMSFEYNDIIMRKRLPSGRSKVAIVNARACVRVCVCTQILVLYYFPFKFSF